MKLLARPNRFFTQSTFYFSTLIRFVLHLLLIIISAALLVGTAKAGVDLYHSLRQPLETILQNVLLDTVFIVALVEIAITILGYLKDGSVHVRYIVDTILIIMLNEVVSAWFHAVSFEKMGALALVIAVLAAVRLTTTRWEPPIKN